MEQVKTAVLSLLMDAYQRRDKVGLVTFRGASAELALPPTSSVEVAARRLTDLPAGGRTPLAEGLLTARETLRLERIRDPRRTPTAGGGHRWAGHLRSGCAQPDRGEPPDSLLRRGCRAWWSTARPGDSGWDWPPCSPQALGAQYVPFGEVGAQSLAGAVREVRGQNVRQPGTRQATVGPPDAAGTT